MRRWISEDCSSTHVLVFGRFLDFIAGTGVNDGRDSFDVGDRFREDDILEDGSTT